MPLVLTNTLAPPAAANSEGLTSMVTSPALTKVVAAAALLNQITLELLKPDPVTCMVRSTPPCTAVAGLRVAATGRGTTGGELSRVGVISSSPWLAGLLLGFPGFGRVFVELLVTGLGRRVHRPRAGHRVEVLARCGDLLRYLLLFGGTDKEHGFGRDRGVAVLDLEGDAALFGEERRIDVEDKLRLRLPERGPRP